MDNKNTTNQDHDEQKGGNVLSTGLGLAVAMALGATLGVLFAPKEGAETQKDIMDKAQKLAKKFNKSRQDVQKNVEKIFGEVTEDLERNYLELQGDILAAVDEASDKVELTEKKYHAIVDEVVKNFSKGKKWSEKIVKDLNDSFVDTWNDLQKAMDNKG